MPKYEYQLKEDEPTEFITNLLGEIEAAQVLDVACGPGGFTGMLAKGIKSFEQITGVDLDEEMIERAQHNFDQENMDFKVMDAAHLDYPDDSFDLVSCAFSLHHLPEPADAINEIKRVLKPGGTTVFVEMYRDHLTETQKTESNLHQWAGRIDTALGLCHRQTYLRQEILDLIDPGQWQSARVYDLADLSFDPKGEDITDLILNTVERVMKRAEGLPDQAEFEQQAEELRQRTHEIGAHISTRLVALLQN